MEKRISFNCGLPEGDVPAELKAVLTNGLLDSLFQLLLLLCQLRVKLPHQLLQCGSVLQLKILLLLSDNKSRQR